jgi:hypothetical protein
MRPNPTPPCPPVRRRPRTRLAATLLLGSLLLGGALLAPQGLSGQTILNTERFQLAEVEGFHMSATLTGNGQRGNSRILTLGTSGIAGILQGSHWTRVIFGGRYISTDERAILDNRFVQLRYSYLFSPELRSFHFVQAQRNETLRLRSRFLVGSGIQYALVNTDRTQVSLGTGLMGEWERLQASAVDPGQDPDSRALRVANVGVFSRDLASGARILNILYVQPDAGRPSDVRVLNDLGLILPVSDRFRVTLSGEWRRDSRPPAALRKDDLTFNVGIGIEVR